MAGKLSEVSTGVIAAHVTNICQSDLCIFILGRMILRAGIADDRLSSLICSSLAQRAPALVTLR